MTFTRRFSFMNQVSRTTRAISILLLLTLGASAAEFYVSPRGTDANPGTKNLPFGTLEKARDALRAIAPVAGGATVYLRGGTYYRTNTLVLTSADSGLAAGSPVVWRSYPGETATLIGGLPLRNWQSFTGNVMVVNIRTESKQKGRDLSDFFGGGGLYLAVRMLRAMNAPSACSSAAYGERSARISPNVANRSTVPLATPACRIIIKSIY